MAVNLAPTFNVGDGMVTNNVITTGIVDFAEIPRPRIMVTSNQHFLVEGITYVGDIFAHNGSYQNAWMSYNFDGSVDSTFGNNGSLLTQPLLSTMLQPDGKMLAINASTGHLGRYNTDGSLDTSFGNGGWASQSNNIDVGGAYSFSNANLSHDIAMQADGKIVVIGAELAQGGTAYSPLVVTRYNIDGSLDANFSGDGILPLSYDASGIRHVTIQADGKILVAISGYSVQSVYLLRLNSDGSPDHSFTNQSIYNAYGAKTFDLIQQADGKIIIASNEWNTTTNQDDVVLRRYDVHGNPDQTFGTSGVVATTANGGDIVLQSDGKILVAGRAGGQFTLIRYNTDGNLDNSFDGDGIVSAPIGGNENTAYSVTVQADQKILVTGLHVNSFGGGRPANGEFVVVRYNPNGSLDATFDPVNTLNNAPSYIENATPAVLDNTVQIYDAELSALNSGNGNYSGASVTLARQGGANTQDVFSGSGNLSFSSTNVVLSGVTIGSLSNTNGTLAITFNANATQARVNEALSSIAYSNTSNTPPSSVQINWTFNDHNTGSQGTDGALATLGSTTVSITATNDAPTFSTAGILINNFGGSFSGARSIAIQSDGKLVVAGSALARFNTDGTLDSSFVISNGIGASSVTLQPDGKIVVAGTASGDFSLARYNTDGTLDTSFGSAGKITTDFGGDDRSWSATLQSDGKILISGVSFGEGGVGTDVLARYNANGSLDTSFDGDGKVTLGSGGYSIGNSAFVQADGKILLAGGSTLARYNTNGSLDTSFDGDGKVTYTLGGIGNVLVQADGKTVVAGSTSNSTGFALARYNTNGSLDTSFDGDGKLTTLLPGGGAAYSLTLQSDGKILVAGFDHASGGTGNNFALARYNANGSLDTTFDGDGIVSTDLSYSALSTMTHDAAWSIKVQADGKIVVVGTSLLQANGFEVVRYNSDGTLDNSFGASRYNTLNNTLSYIENSSAVVLDDTVLIYDPELAALGGGLGNYNGASVTLSRHGGANVQDIFSGTGNLSFTNGNVILSGVTVGSVSNGNGILTISFNNNATQSVVNQTLSAIAYSNTSDTPPSGVQIDWAFSDGNTGTQGIGGALNASGSTSVYIVAVNDLPVLTGTKATLTSGIQDAPYTVTASSLLAGFTDAEGDTLSVANLTANHGSVVNNGNGTFTITPEASYSGVVNLSYLVSDGSGGTVTTQSFVLGNSVSSNNPLLADANLRYAALSNLSASNGLDALTTSFDNLAFFDVGSFNTLNARSISGTLTNGDFFSIQGSNLLSYPSTITRLDYSSVGNIQLSTSGSVTQASEFSDVVGKLNNIVVTDNRYGAGHQVVYTFNGSFDVNGVGTDTFNNIEVKQDGNSFFIAGNLYSDDFSPSGISGTITSIQFNLGTYAANLTGLNISYSVFDSYTNLTDLLTNALSGNNTLNGTGANDVILGFAGNDALLGLAGNDTLDGGTGNDTLDGGTGIDTLIGGAGDDIYVVDSTTDTITEAANEGNDTVQSSVTYTLTAANVENLTLTGTGAINGTGNSFNNALTGNSGNNVLDGGAGADTLTGGDGNDTYIVDNTLDVVTETNANPVTGGIDTVQASFSYVLGANVENLTLTGTSAINGTGNSLNNIIVGNAGNNVLDGGAGADTMQGGAGSDTYIVDNVGDVISEELVSNNAPTLVQADFGVFTPSISADGRYVSFESYSEFNFGNTTPVYDVFIKDMQTGLLIKANDYSEAFANEISPDGKFLLYTTSAAMTGDTNNVRDIYLKDLLTGATTIITTSSSGQLGNNDPLLDVARFSGDGKFVSFTSYASNLTANDTNASADVFVKNLTTGTTSLVSSNSAGVQANNTSAVSSISADGRYVTFHTLATNLSAADTNGVIDVYWKDTLSGQTKLVSSNASGVVGNAISWYSSISSDGNLVAFESSASNLVADNNLATDIFVKNISTGSIQRVSTSSTGAESNGASQNASFSADGRYVVFESTASNLVANDTNDSSDVFIKDLQTGAIQRVSTNSSNQEVFGGHSSDASISDNGRYVVFTSLSSGLVVGDTNNVGDVFVKDLLTGEVKLASVQSTTNTNSDVDTVMSSVSYTLALGLENLTLTGAGAINGTGNSVNNVLTGNAGNNTLDGGAGVDTLIGGLGNDTYIVDNVGDVITENAGEGTDSVQSSVSYTLGANVENLTLTGSSGLVSASAKAGQTNMHGMFGLNSDPTTDANYTSVDYAWYTAANGTLSIYESGSYIGSFGAYTTADVLTVSYDGSSIHYQKNGVDVRTIATTGGRNFYFDSSLYDTGFSLTSIQTGGVPLIAGSSHVSITDSTITKTGVTGWSNAGAYSSDILQGVAHLNGTGNGDNNVLTGNAGNNILIGNGGNDTLDGGAGVDTLIGGLGNDILTGGIGADVFKWGLADKGTAGNISNNTDTISDFSFSATQGDRLDLRDLLIGENSSNILNYIDVISNAGNTTIHISSTGGFTGGTYAVGSEDARIVLNNIDLFTATGTANEANLLQSLIQNNKLIIDA